MSINLPNSPVRKISICHKCDEVSVKFYNPIHNRTFNKDEWQMIITEGRAILEKITSMVTQDPKQFP